jgi:hypothetical protein
MMGAVDAIHRVQQPNVSMPLKFLRSLGMIGTHGSSFIKGNVARFAMGLL